MRCYWQNKQAHFSLIIKVDLQKNPKYNIKKEESLKRCLFQFIQVYFTKSTEELGPYFPT